MSDQKVELECASFGSKSHADSAPPSVRLAPQSQLDKENRQEKGDGACEIQKEKGQPFHKNTEYRSQNSEFRSSYDTEQAQNLGASIPETAFLRGPLREDSGRGRPFYIRPGVCLLPPPGH
jgi:hypothetical protein